MRWTLADAAVTYTKDCSELLLFAATVPIIWFHQHISDPFNAVNFTAIGQSIQKNLMVFNLWESRPTDCFLSSLRNNTHQSFQKDNIYFSLLLYG